MHFHNSALLRSLFNGIVLAVQLLNVLDVQFWTLQALTLPEKKQNKMAQRIRFSHLFIFLFVVTWISSQIFKIRP